MSRGGCHPVVSRPPARRGWSGAVPEPVSRCSARSAARTYDLDSGEDRADLSPSGRGGVGSWSSLLCGVSGWVVCVLASALACLGARTRSRVRRHDDRLGVPRDECGRSICCGPAGASSVHAGGGAGREQKPHARWRHRDWLGSDARHVSTVGHTAANASSPRARGRWWQRRVSLRATDSIARLLPSRFLTCW